MADAVLTLNAGSSSIKFALFETEGQHRRVAHGAIENIGEAPHFQGYDQAGDLATEKRWEGEGLSHEDLLSPVLDWVESHRDGDRLAAAGHRIVHGGTEFAGPVRIDEGILAALDRLTRRWCINTSMVDFVVSDSRYDSLMTVFQ